MPEVRQTRFLAIDQGSHSSRALVFDGQGEMLAAASASLDTLHPRPGWVEQDAMAVIAATRQAIGSALAGFDPGDVRSAGLATQRSSIVCWDRETGQPLTPVISWQDRRAADWLDAFSDQAEVVHRITGLMLSPHYGASKLRWCLDHASGVWDALQRGTLLWGPLASFLVFHLLEERPHIIDPANASRTMLWNLATSDWDPALISLFGLPRAPFPSCVPSTGMAGHVALAGHRIPMRVITGDQSAALFADGMPRADTAYVTVGTGAFIQRPLDKPEIVPRLLTSPAIAGGDRPVYALEGTVNGAASAIDWFEHQYGVEDVVQHLPAWLGRECELPIFINGIGGLGSPYWKPVLASGFVGRGEPWQQAVAVVESIIFLIQANLDVMAESHSLARSIRIGGGLARLDGVCQRLADLSGLPVLRPYEVEATARGLAFLLSNEANSWPLGHGCSRFVPLPNAALKNRCAVMHQHLAQVTV